MLSAPLLAGVPVVEHPSDVQDGNPPENAHTNRMAEVVPQK